MRFITKTIHSDQDYPVAVAFALMVLPFAISLGVSYPMAKWLGMGTGVAALILTLLTNQKTGVSRAVPDSAHLTVDLLVGITFVAAPFVLGFSEMHTWFYWLNAAAVLSVASLHQPESDPSTALA